MVVEYLKAYRDNTAKVRLLQLEIDGLKKALADNVEEIVLETDIEAIEGMSLSASTVDDFKPDCFLYTPDSMLPSFFTPSSSPEIAVRKPCLPPGRLDTRPPSSVFCLPSSDFFLTSPSSGIQ